MKLSVQTISRVITVAPIPWRAIPWRVIGWRVLGVVALPSLAAGAEDSSLLGGYAPTVSPFPPQLGPPSFSSNALLLIAALAGLLVVVAIQGLRSARSEPPTETEPLPRLGVAEAMALLGLILIASVAFLVPSYLRHANYGISSWDIGIYTHAFWNALHGQGLFNSPEGMDHLSSHASPGLYLLLPFYALAPNPFTLLSLNGLALVSGAIPAYLLARRSFGAVVSLLCAAVYLVNPFLGSLNYDVHEVTFAVPLLLWGMLFLETRRAVPMLISLCLALLFKEDIGVFVAFIGAYVLLFQKRSHLGAATILLGLLWVVVGVSVIITYHGGSHASAHMSRYSSLGDNWIDILLSPLLHPTAFFGIVFSRATATYLTIVLAPFAFLPLLAPQQLVMAVPPLAVNILSDEAVMRSGESHYEALLLPALYLSFVTALARVSALGHGAPRPMAGWTTWGQSLFLALLVCANIRLHRFVGRGFLEGIEGDPARAEIDAIVDRVPPGVPAVSPQHIQPHLSNRTVSAYLNNVNDFTTGHPPFLYAVIPADARRPPATYEVVWQGESYSLFRLSSAAGDGASAPR